MRQDQLHSQRVQRLEPGGIDTEPASTRLVVWGIQGGSDFVTGIAVGDLVLGRLAGEDTDALRIRARRNLPANPLRDSKGSAVGYFIYAGLPPDHCRAQAYKEGAR
jgi:hypothetical protein